MQKRLLAFLPLSVLLAFILLALASSFVSAIERSTLFGADRFGADGLGAGGLEGTDGRGRRPIRVVLYETECESLYREMHALSHERSECGDPDICQGSPLLCPQALDESIDRDFERLRDALHERCGMELGLLDFAWGQSSANDVPCGAAHDWLEAAASGDAEPATFRF